AWMEDVALAPEFPWGVFAEHKAVHGALVFPVVVGEQVFAVLAFLSRQVQPVDDELLKATQLIGSQIAQFVERRRAEEAFELSEARFAVFMQHLPGIAFMKDLEGRYIYHSARPETLGGRRGADIVGKTDDEVFPPEFAALYRFNDLAAIQSGAPIEVVECCRHDDEIHEWLLYKFPIFDRT